MINPNSKTFKDSVAEVLTQRILNDVKVASEYMTLKELGLVLEAVTNAVYEVQINA